MQLKPNEVLSSKVALAAITARPPFSLVPMQ